MDHPIPARSTARMARKFKTNLSEKTTVISASPESSVVIEALELVTPEREFIKSISIEGRFGSDWKPLAENEVIFRQSAGAERLRAPIPAGSWEEFRITVNDGHSRPIPFTAIRIVTATAVKKPETQARSVTLGKREEINRETTLTLDLGAANLDIAELHLEISDAVFSRQCVLSYQVPSPDGGIRIEDLATSTIYRVRGEQDVSAEDLVIPIHRRVPSRYVIATFRNGDSPPLTVSGATFRSYPTILTFHAGESGTWRLMTGQPRGKMPEYDLQPLRGAMTNVGGAPITAGELVENLDYRAPLPLPGVETVGTSIDLTKWSRRRKVDAPASGVVRIELDALALAASRTDLGDIRLVQDGRQIAYLVRPGTVLRELKPSGVVMKNDPERPTVSRWEITMPMEGLPAVNLGARSSAGLFVRKFLATIHGKDSLGNSWSNELATAEWTKSGSNEEPLVLSLRGSRLPKTIFLETDHGDNPPIPVEDLVVRYAAPSIAAKLDGNAPYFLYYGNPDANPPQYDLRLVSKELMTTDQQSGTLGTEELLKALPEKPGAMDAGSPWLWVALAGVVIALLVIVARLLPSAPEA